MEWWWCWAVTWKCIARHCVWYGSVQEEGNFYLEVEHICVFIETWSVISRLEMAFWRF